MLDLRIRSLHQAYQSRTISPEALIRQVYDQIAQHNDPALWIYLAPLADTLDRVAQTSPDLPLYGIPFALKDNIDWAGTPTTAACPEFAYTPATSATVVARLCAAGAIPIGKTNLDQFATGLVGTRSPYGICRNLFCADYIPGGSSSGSGAAVGAGLVSFALGTDTAGSGRVPAAFNNIVGLKPTRGYISTKGVVPAVRSLDCVSIFALTCVDAQRVLQVAGGFDPEDVFARIEQSPDQLKPDNLANLRFGVPDVLEFFGNQDAAANYQKTLARLQDWGCQITQINFQPYAEVAALLYEGAWLAERTAAVGEFVAVDRPGLDPTVKEIIRRGAAIDAVSAYRDLYRLKALERQIAQQPVDVLVMPTTGTIYTIDQVTAQPVELNRNLGLYTNFVNLLDLSAIAVPNGFQANGLPTGVTFMAAAWQDHFLCELGHRFQAELGGTLGATHILFRE